MPRRSPTIRARWAAFRALPGILQAIGWGALVIVLALILLPGPARADLVIRNPQTGAELRLTNAPCTHAGTLAVIPVNLRAQFRRAVGVLRGETLEACWAEDGDQALLVFDDGTGLTMDLADFQDTAI